MIFFFVPLTSRGGEGGIKALAECTAKNASIFLRAPKCNYLVLHGLSLYTNNDYILICMTYIYCMNFRSMNRYTRHEHLQPKHKLHTIFLHNVHENIDICNYRSLDICKSKNLGITYIQIT